MRIDSAIITGSFSVNGDTFNDLGSYSTTGSNTFVGNQSIVGAVSASALTGSINFTNLTGVPTLVSGSEQIVGILSPLNSFSASNSTTNTFTSSATARLNSIETITSSNVARLNSLENKTGSLASTGSNTFIGNQTISGTVYIQNDLIVQGSSSLQNITASAVSIGTNIVNLNTANPSIRFAGLSIVDSGSVGGSGSFLYDSLQDEFIFVHRGAATIVTSSVILMGPQTFDSIGSETYLTNNRLVKGAGNEHLADSNISDTGTLVTINSVTSSFNGIVGIGITNPSQTLSVNGNVNIGNLNTTLNFTSGSNAKFLEIGALGADALLVTHASGFGVGYFGYSAADDRLVVACDNGAGANKIDFIVNAGGTTGGGTNNLSGILPAMRITSASSVGIGTTSPGTRLEVLSTAASADRTLPHNILTLTAEQGNAPYGPFGGAILFKNRSYTSGMVESSRIRSVIYDDGVPFNFGGGLWFETTPTPGGTLTPSLIINYQGRVGIGLTAPLTTFTVKSTNDNGYALTRPSDGTTYHWRLSTTETGGDAYTVRYNTFNNEMLFTTYASGGTGGNIFFRTGANSGNETERLRIQSNGNISIGGVGAGSKLTIYEGDIRLYKNHLIDNAPTWLSNINFTDEVDRLGARITGERTAWDGAPMGLGFDTGGVGTVTRRMTITSGGNVGIGTTNPGSRLTISRATEAQAYQLQLRVVGGIADGNYDGITFTQGAAGATPLGSIRMKYASSGYPSFGIYTRSDSAAEAERLSISNAGYVNKPFQPAFKAGLASSISVGANSTIVFTDTGGNHFNIGGHYNTSNGMFTAPIAGRYVFSACVIYQSMAAGQSMDDAFYIYRNSTLVAYSFRRAEYEAGFTGNGGYYVDHANTLLNLAAGDTVSIRNNRALDVHGNTNYCFFYGYMLG